MKEEPEREQRHAEDSSREIEVVARARLLPPAHRGEKLKGLRDVRQNDEQYADCTKKLEPDPHRRVSDEQDGGARNEDAYRTKAISARASGVPILRV